MSCPKRVHFLLLRRHRFFFRSPNPSQENKPDTSATFDPLLIRYRFLGPMGWVCYDCIINFSCFSLFPKASTGWIQTKAVITTQNTCTAISKEEPLVFFQITKRLSFNFNFAYHLPTLYQECVTVKRCPHTKLNLFHKDANDNGVFYIAHLQWFTWNTPYTRFKFRIWS